MTGDGARLPTGRRLLRRHPLIASLALVLVVFLVASSLLFVWPATDQPRHVDAILSLNGTNEGDRENTAVSLAREGYAPVLLFSQGAANTTCQSVPRVSVMCFAPHPAETIGEIRYAATEARRHGWHSLMVVAGRAQVTPSHVLMERCFSGQILMVSTVVHRRELPYQVIYEWGALIRAELFDEHC